MSAHEGEERPADSWRTTLRRFAAPFSVIATVLYVGIYASEAYEYFHPKNNVTPETREKGDSFPEAMKAATQRQVNELEKVDSRALTDVFVKTVGSTTCTWLFQCVPTPPVVEPTLGRWDGELQHRMERVTQPEPPTLLYHPGWIIYLPSAQLIKGAPHALVVTAGEIRRAGGWAVAMFLSCTVIWLAAIWLLVKDGEGMPMAYLMFLGSLFAISVMVSAVQEVSEFMLQEVGSTMGLLVVVAAHSGAIALLVGLKHVLEAPHEVKKAVSVYRKET